MFEAPPERQLELIRSYPNLGAMARKDEAAARLGLATEEYEALKAPAEGILGLESVRDQSSAGLDRLSPEEYAAFGQLNRAYRDRFGFPLIVCVRENTKETILASGKARLENAPAQERATALVEIAKIANLRLLDLVVPDHGAAAGAGAT
jgi:OHCU decarboxylase